MKAKVKEGRSVDGSHNRDGKRAVIAEE